MLLSGASVRRAGQAFSNEAKFEASRDAAGLSDGQQQLACRLHSKVGTHSILFDQPWQGRDKPHLSLERPTLSIL